MVIANMAAVAISRIQSRNRTSLNEQKIKLFMLIPTNKKEYELQILHNKQSQPMWKVWLQQNKMQLLPLAMELRLWG